MTTTSSLSLRTIEHAEENHIPGHQVECLPLVLVADLPLGSA
jgi:hypothetical protein